MIPRSGVKVLRRLRFFWFLTSVFYICSCGSSVVYYHTNPEPVLDQVAQVWVTGPALNINTCDGKRLIANSFLVTAGTHTITGWIEDRMAEQYTRTFSLTFHAEAGHSYIVQYAYTGNYTIFIVDKVTGKPVQLLSKDSSQAAWTKLADIDKKLLAKPQSYDLWLNKGLLLRQLNQYEEALAAFDTATQMTTNAGMAWKQKSELLVELKRYDEAMTAITRAILASPVTQGWYVEKQKIARLQSGGSDKEDFSAAYGEIISISPSQLVIQHSTRPFVVKENYDSHGIDVSAIKKGDKVYIEYLDGKPRVLKTIERQ